METFDPERVPAADRATSASPTPSSCRRCSCACSACPQEVRERYDVSSLQVVDARRRAVPGAGEASDDRLVGPDHPRVLRRHRRHRRHVHHRRGVARPSRLGRPADSRSATSSATTARSCRPGEVGRRVLRRRTTVRVPQRPRQDRVDHQRARAGARSATSGYLDDDGYLYLTDRAAHMIISGGVNIYPQETENVLAGHPAVADVAVIGVPDAEMGEAVKAVVRARRPGRRRAGARRRSCSTYCRGRAGDVQVPAQRRLRRRAPRATQRQALQAPAPRALLGRPRLPCHLMSTTNPIGNADTPATVLGVGENTDEAPTRWRSLAGRTLRRPGP